MLVTDPQTSRRMAAQRRKDTAAEVKLRRILHARGLRYRVDAPIQGMSRRRADLTFAGSRIVVFVDGCFWHGCQTHKSTPKTNAEWWIAKLSRNVARDRETDAHLVELNWRPIRIWEHEDPEQAADLVEVAVRSASRKRS